MVATADKMMTELEAMGKDLGAAGTDCKKAATALKDHAAKLKPIAAEIEGYKTKDDKAAEEWFKTTYMQRAMNAMGPMMGLASQCGADADFQAAMKEMSEGMAM
jgi:hypothetical protein